MTHPLALQVRKELHDHDGDCLLQVDGVVFVNYHWLSSNPQFSLLLLNLLFHPSCEKYSWYKKGEIWFTISEKYMLKIANCKTCKWWTYPSPPPQSPCRQPSSPSPQGQSCIQREGYQAHHQGQGLQGDQLLPGPLHRVKGHLRSLLVLRVLVRVNLSKHCFKRLLFQCNILIKMLHFRLLWQSITFRSILKIMNMFAHHYRHSSKLLFRIVHWCLWIDL